MMVTPAGHRDGSTGGRRAALLPESGPGQVRYGEYFCRVLYAPILRSPLEMARQLKQVVFSPMSKLELSACTDGAGVDGFWTGDVSPFLVVFQHGRRVWAGFAESQVDLSSSAHRGLGLGFFGGGGLGVTCILCEITDAG